MKDWPHPSDPPPEAKYLLGGCAVMVVAALGIMIWSMVAA